MFEKIGNLAEDVAANVGVSRRNFLGWAGRGALALAGVLAPAPSPRPGNERSRAAREVDARVALAVIDALAGAEGSASGHRPRRRRWVRPADHTLTPPGADTRTAIEGAPAKRTAPTGVWTHE